MPSSDDIGPQACLHIGEFQPPTIDWSELRAPPAPRGCTRSHTGNASAAASQPVLEGRARPRGRRPSVIRPTAPRLMLSTLHCRLMGVSGLCMPHWPGLSLRLSAHAGARAPWPRHSPRAPASRGDSKVSLGPLAACTSPGRSPYWNPPNGSSFHSAPKPPHQYSAAAHSQRRNSG